MPARGPSSPYSRSASATTTGNTCSMVHVFPVCSMHGQQREVSRRQPRVVCCPQCFGTNTTSSSHLNQGGRLRVQQHTVPLRALKPARPRELAPGVCPPPPGPFQPTRRCGPAPPPHPRTAPRSRCSAAPTYHQRPCEAWLRCPLAARELVHLHHHPRGGVQKGSLAGWVRICRPLRNACSLSMAGWCSG